MTDPKHIFGQDDGGWGQPNTCKVFNEHIILCFGVNPLELLMTTKTNGAGHACHIYINHYTKNMDRDMCTSWAHHVGMCRQAFTIPQGDVQANTSTGDRTCKGKSTGQLQGILENCASILAQWKGFLWQTHKLV